MTQDIEGRITNYLASGGLFSPEMMPQGPARDLLIDCRDTLATLTKRLEEAEAVIRPFAKFAGDLSVPKNRFFLQLLVCPEGDDHPENYGSHFQRARRWLEGK